MSSIHGAQFLLPLFMRRESGLPSIEDDAELALAFYLCTKDLDDSLKISSFSKLLWPVLSIQGGVSSHIMLDGLMVFSKKDKFTNPPRQPLIGHILRNVNNMTHIEQLEKIIEIIQYKDKGAEELGEGEESEYQVYQINSLINPEFLETLKRLIPYLEYRPIEGYMPLDTSLSTEKALDLAEKYREIIKTLKGNAHRWETQIDLIGDQVEKWLLELNVEIKDITSRYKSQIEKTSSTIDDVQINDQIKQKSDAVEQWRINEKKRILENLAVLFKGLNREIEEALRKNKFFSSDDTIKRKSFENIIPSIENHFTFLEEFGSKYKESINSIKTKFNEFKEQANQIDLEAKQRLDNFKNDLETKLKQRDEKLSQFEMEKKVKLEELKTRRNKLEELYTRIKNITLEKKNDCLQEAEKLSNWSIQDTEAELFAKPIQWIYMPMYAMFVEDESMMEEFMQVVLPGYIIKNSGDLHQIYEVFSESMENLKNYINEKIEDDMALRSNFEFSCENNNILKIQNIEKRVQRGVSFLRKIGIIDQDIDLFLKSKLNEIL